MHYCHSHGPRVGSLGISLRGQLRQGRGGDRGGVGGAGQGAGARPGVRSRRRGAATAVAAVMVVN